MTREFMALATQALQPLLLAVIAAFGAWAAAALRRWTQNARIAAVVDTITRGAEGVVADIAQHVVDDLKDPSKPGSWDAVSQAAARRTAIERIRRLLPGDVAALEAHVGLDAAAELLGTLVERAVVASKGGR